MTDRTSIRSRNRGDHTQKSLHTSRSCACVLAAVGALGCSEPQGAALGTVIAASVDPQNGIPTVVVNGYYCDDPGNRCTAVEFAQYDSSFVDVPTDFAARLNIPVVDAADLVAPSCSWSSAPADSVGMYAWFMRPPAPVGDSIVVELMSGCRDGGEAFYQSHDFVVKRAKAGWQLVRRSRTSVS